MTSKTKKKGINFKALNLPATSLAKSIIYKIV